jgi:polysaccharide pyruvyl transferase WcaK-like protein
MKSDKPVIGVFGHYGNHNLGDESIIESSIQQVRRRLPEAEIRCFSLRPDDTAQRHRVPAYSVRYLASGREYLLPGETDTFSLPWKVYARQQQARSDGKDGSADPRGSRSAKGLKERLKAMPLLGWCLKFAIRVFHILEGGLNELRYLGRSYRYLKKFDLLIVAGSNQFLDNFNGPWGFPYTLMKWSIMAKLANVKLAYVSVGANPLASSLSKRMI